MAQPAASPSEFQPYRKVQGDAEKELAAVLEAAAKQIKRRVAGLKPGVGGQVRKAQLTVTLNAIRRVQQAMWTTGVSGTVARGMVNAEKAAESAIETMTRVAYTALPDAAAEELVRGLRLAAESGLKSDAARRKRELSTAVYHNAALANGKVEQMIRTGLVQNLTAKELADNVYQYVSPSTKGGASYAAMRLARTEINNAFHERQLLGAERPGVAAVKWNLSGSHVVPDLCNVYADHGGNGEWEVGKVPEKPHPQCFCYLTYITQKPSDFRKDLAEGKFDDEIDRRTRENMARLGQPVGNIPATKPQPKPKLTLVKTKPEPVDDGKTYKPGNWKRFDDKEALITEMEARLRKALPKGDTTDVRAMAKEFIDETTEENDLEYRNGPHVLRFTGDLTEEQRKTFMGHVDELESQAPTGRNMHINIAAASTFDSDTGGETTLATGYMRINENVIKRKTWPGMPASSDVSSALYVLAHEWGHSFPTKEEARDQAVYREAIAARGMTRYGKTAPEESYAEAFAEWFLTKGKTTNPAALVYAKHFGWRKRFGI
jgi:hypothetical protein